MININLLIHFNPAFHWFWLSAHPLVSDISRGGGGGIEMEHWAKIG